MQWNITSFLIVLLMSKLVVSWNFKDPRRFEYSCKLDGALKPDATSIPLMTFDSDQNLKIFVTNRTSHQIVSRIFAIFLKEILNYSETDIVRLEHIADSQENRGVLVPQVNIYSERLHPVINLQVWVPPEPHPALNSITSGGNVFQGNRLTDDIFRYGLFYKRSLNDSVLTYRDFAETATNNGNFVIEDENVIDQFVLENLQYDRNTSIYQPLFCEKNEQRCATVLTSHREDMSFFIGHIEKFKLRMNLYFLGDNLRLVINNLEIVNKSSNRTKNNRVKTAKYFVLHWNNSEIIDNSYAAVTMPPCELYFDFEKRENVCRYEITPVSIFYNSLVMGNPKNPTALFNTLGKVHIDSIQTVYAIHNQYVNQIENLRQQFGADDEQKIIEAKEEYYNQIACEWLQKNQEVWTIDTENSEKSWISLKQNDKKIMIGALYPDKNSGPEYVGVHVASDLMRKYLNNQSRSRFGGYEIEISSHTSECKPDIVLKNFLKFYSDRSNIIGVVGPSCTEAIQPLADISKHFKLNTITYSADGIPLDDRENYPYFYRTIGETKLYQQVYEKLITHWNWKRIFALTEEGMKYTQYITALETRLKENDPNFHFLNKKFERDPEKHFEKFRNHLRELKEVNRAKIIIADVHDHNLMKSIMCSAQELKMTAQSGFVWFLPVYVSTKINETLQHAPGNATFGSSKCSNLDISNAMQGHFAFSYKSFADDAVKIDEGITVKQWHENFTKLYKQENEKRNNNNTYNRYDDYGGFTYDALWVYIKAIEELAKASTKKHQYITHLESDETMEKLSEIINKMDFQGVSGRVKFNKGSRHIDVNVLQWQDNTFKLVGTYQPDTENASDIGSLLMFDELISWPGNQRPDDGSEICALLPLARAIRLDCHAMDVMLIILACFALIFVCSSFAIWVWKRKYDRRLDEVAYISNSYHKVVNGIELSEREVRRENVVINRRIGEGQFGMVYGGEALIPGATEGWQAVAIKTLKPGADVSSRVDFLAESETMKKFDHPNTVKLLGVCLQKEPLYAIMEFMLYGDLKTYLLARRHLLNNRINDESDISPKRLTLMALDVARGLAYLGSLNFVHRDIACRNCMINGDRVVKIGDFGLTRKTYEQDYYKFSRTGLLPVRWMPKESIVKGNFSHASDVWAFGVLLYEIITLGGFPFQGISDHEVIDIVKENGSLKIPIECKSQLKAIMTTCFNPDPQKRPKASTLVEYILHYPRMVSACRGAPQPNLEDEEVITDQPMDLLDWESQTENNDFVMSPIDNGVDVLKTSASLPAVHTHHQENAESPEDNFEYMDMKPHNLNNSNLLTNFNPDLTATLPNSSIYNPIEPLLHRPEVSKSNNASPSTRIMRYMPMCGKKNNRSSPEEGLNQLKLL